MEELKRAGLFGGSFNPVHLGHLKAACEIRELLSMDKIIFIPTLIHPQYKDVHMADAADRCNMLELAVSDYPHFEVSEIELKREGPSYTIDTLKHFSELKDGFNYYFILGNEIFLKIETWKDYTELFKYSNFVVISRPGFKNKNFEEMIPSGLKNKFKPIGSNDKMVLYKNEFGYELIFLEIKGIKISSTQVRNLVKNNRPIDNLVPKEVATYILSNNIYTGVRK